MAEYSDTLIEHFSNPRNVGELEGACAMARVGNPVCGDQLQLFARIEGSRVTRCTYLAYGCAASLATGSLLTEALSGLSVEQLLRITEAEIADLAGGLTPAQRHCAAMAREAIELLVSSYRDGGALAGPQGEGCR